MSRLSMLGIDDGPPARAPQDGPVLRRNRRRPLHPETIQDLLREKAARNVVRRGPTPWGWEVRGWFEDGQRRRYETGPNGTYEDAKALREEMVSDGAWMVWLKAKTEP
jgi:hypothetical protein